MNLTPYLNRPEYFFRPIQAFNRILKQDQEKVEKYNWVQLPWGCSIKVSTVGSEPVNLSLLHMGLYDLVVTETLWRLLDAGETAVDVGANIGYMTNIMAAKTGNTGKVYCFEPNPDIYSELVANTNDWQSKFGFHHIKVEQIALSNQSGNGLLSVPENSGEAKLVEYLEVKSEEQLNDKHPQTYQVNIKRLDEVIDKTIGVLKIDVEGHELSVIQGASQLIIDHKIRDIVFEEHEGYPSPVSDFLETHGYTIFRLWKGFWKPILYRPNTVHFHPWEPPSYLATLDEKRAKNRFEKIGWLSLMQH
ncbi:FkbM family methyltransferase [Nostoc sp. CCY0012]|uniref:FkbM family methyltransferase n=1 Tax=Nostoc sp. CCY0012 TaxID=1056123 RepID=UPI0039C6136B